MLLLTSTADRVLLVTSSADSIEVHASYVDNVSGEVLPGRKNTLISSATTTTIVESPSSSTTQRNVRTLYIKNEGLGTNTLTVNHDNGSIVSTIWSGEVGTKEELILVQDGSWHLYAASGLEKVYSTGGGGAGTDLSWDAATRTIASSTGTDAVITEATTSLPGLMSAVDKALVNQAATVTVAVRNTSGATLTKGSAVYVTGAHGATGLITVALADASTEATAAQTLGLIQADITNNSNGTVIAVGELTGLNTSSLTEGAIVWLSETAGDLTTTRPTQPAHGVVLGYCARSNASTGIVYIKVDNGQELDELHDVLITSATTDQALMRASDGLWKNKTITPSLIGAAVAGAVGSSNITMNTARLLGRTTASSGSVEEITIGSGLSLSAGTLTATGGGGGGSGTVTSVGLSLPSIFNVTNSPVTTTGTLTGTLATQSANLVFVGPSSGAAAAPTFRQLGYSELSGLPTLGNLAALNTVGTTQIDNDAVTYAKLQNVTSNRLLGRSTAGSGDTEEIAIGSGLSLTAGTLTATSSAPIYQEYTSSDTWNSSSVTGRTFYYVEVVGGGGGGGGGRSGASTAARAGGGGGAGGTLTYRWGRIADLGSSQSVTIGAGGTGGTSSTNANGGNGAAGGTSSFGSVLSAIGGSGGSGGTSSTGPAGAIRFRGNAAFGAGFAGAGGAGARGDTSAASGQGSIGAYGPGGGGGGGGITANDTAVLVPADGGAGFAQNVGNATMANATTGGGSTLPGDGGGGGAASTTGAGTSGSVGVVPGGGGGGGGACTNTAAAGAGGNGAAGIVRIWFW